jgi:hypothetical protein
VGDVVGSDGSVVGAGTAEVEGCLGKRLDGDRNFDLSNGSVVDDFLSGEVIGDGAEMGAFVVLS